MPKSIVAALQIGALPEGKAATLEQILSYQAAIIEAGAQLVVMPEALLGGYPKGEGFGTQLGYRLPEGREAFARYFANAIDVPGAETEALAGLSARTGANLVLGVIERSGSTLYCTALYFDPQAGLVGKHRKLMPTGTERLIWGKGDGSTLPVLDTQVGRLGAVICWENMMPLLRTAMYAQGIEVWCAPTVDEREMWQVSMRHIAHEGRCFVVSACQVQASPEELGLEIANWPAQRPLIAGGSVIVGPMGDVLAGPLVGRAGLISAEIDTADLVRARYDYDVVGHYARPDVFELSVDQRPRPGVRFT
ncbi:carbon-nitrogen hydrolase family protein [Pseudomonas sp. 3MA1]|uniref:carbon-nitrogen hydrolase family protein n=1 Tax=Pseudomonas TaxID=286 RepID=UPI000CDAD782|nr:MULTISPECIES: carbon-nitrogen hydrolase family protein [Pseudomonas]MCO7571849.1 carbon-nitrogen hydrolase family protein [Pseudomonas chlororaphis]MCO7589629.1 carbon-nitrogen hydrolase family protein [Pseudomonas chlororaphis]MDF2398594.1 carbon-nitrogen hydrolase family protein [Pseudomonas sp. 3MA1]RBJ85589.1 carbon-nitrogen hydrolase family protein [Pseudomonas sp. MWU12-2534b]